MKIYLPKSLDEEIVTRQVETRRIREEILKRRESQLPATFFEDILKVMPEIAREKIEQIDAAVLESLAKEAYQAATNVEMNFFLAGNVTNGDIIVDCAHFLYYSNISDKGWLCYPYVFGDEGDKQRSKKESKARLEKVKEKIAMSGLEIVAQLHSHPGECTKLVPLSELVDNNMLELMKTTEYLAKLLDYLPMAKVEDCEPSIYCFSPHDLDYISKSRMLGSVAVLYCESGKKYVATNPEMNIVDVVLY